jgi:hypothetical protein
MVFCAMDEIQLLELASGVADLNVRTRHIANQDGNNDTRELGHAFTAVSGHPALVRWLLAACPLAVIHHAVMRRRVAASDRAADAGTRIRDETWGSRSVLMRRRLR